MRQAINEALQAPTRCRVIRLVGGKPRDLDIRVFQGAELLNKHADMIGRAKRRGFLS